MLLYIGIRWLHKVYPNSVQKYMNISTKKKKDIGHCSDMPMPHAEKEQQ